MYFLLATGLLWATVTEQGSLCRCATGSNCFLIIVAQWIMLCALLCLTKQFWYIPLDYMMKFGLREIMLLCSTEQFGYSAVLPVLGATLYFNLLECIIILHGKVWYVPMSSMRQYYMYDCPMWGENLVYALFLHGRMWYVQLCYIEQFENALLCYM